LPSRQWADGSAGGFPHGETAAHEHFEIAIGDRVDVVEERAQIANEI
jgi:hypothetical protein